MMNLFTYLGRTVEIIYLNRNGELSQRKIRLLSVKDGRILLSEEIVKNRHSDLLDLQVNGDKLLAKESEPDYIFIWNKE
ncbi:hypothetical protein P9597_31055 [Aneurinibacillus migulanus]|uniref:hypothetical protein n=1 Tax=Aneurinibacillus migulanus TaxID=47500 RepID=UPI002E1AF26D|nr:hypothetical protein [Aneurinibacillus migulanus]